MTCTPKGFINDLLFVKWLYHFDLSVPDSVKQPLVLLYNDCSSHYNAEIMSRVVKLKVNIVSLRDNSTYLTETLGKSVFKTFSYILCR